MVATWAAMGAIVASLVAVGVVVVFGAIAGLTYLASQTSIPTIATPFSWVDITLERETVADRPKDKPKDKPITPVTTRPTQPRPGNIENAPEVEASVDQLLEGLKAGAKTRVNPRPAPDTGTKPKPDNRPRPDTRDQPPKLDKKGRDKNQ